LYPTRRRTRASVALAVVRGDGGLKRGGRSAREVLLDAIVEGEGATTGSGSKIRGRRDVLRSTLGTSPSRVLGTEMMNTPW